MRQYLALLRHVRTHGARKADRTGTGTLAVCGWQLLFDLGAGFPLVTTKKLHLKSIVHELLWFLRGETNVRYLREHGVSIWDEWADEAGERGAAQQPRLAAHHRQRLERRRARAHGLATVPRVLPVLRRRRQAQLPALPAQRGPVPRRAVQHRELRGADAHGRAAVRSRRRRFRLDRRR